MEPSIVGKDAKVGRERIPMLSDHQCNEKDPSLMERMLSRRSSGLINLDRVLMNSPKIASVWNDMFRTLRNSLSIRGRTRELVILRIAVINRAYYEFYQHYDVFIAEGGTIEEALMLGRWVKATDLYDPDDRAVLAYTDESTKNIQISDTTFDALAQFYSKEQVVEIATLCAGYNMVSRFIEATQVEPESRAKVAELPALPIDEVGV